MYFKKNICFLKTISTPNRQLRKTDFAWKFTSSNDSLPLWKQKEITSLDTEEDKLHNLRVAIKNIPSITIETEDYAYISKMNNHSVVHVFLSYERNQRRSSLPDNTTYNSYVVRHYPNRVVVCLVREAEIIYNVIFVPTSHY